MKKGKIIVILFVLALVFACGMISVGCGGPRVDSISVTKAPTKKEYVEGESFDTKGMVVTAKYTDDTTEAVTTYTWSPDGALAVGTTEITITFEGKTTTTPITVKAKAVQTMTVTTQPTKREYTATEQFDPTGMVIEGKYNDGTTATVPNADCTYAFTDLRDGVIVSLTSNPTVKAEIVVKGSFAPKNFGSQGWSGNADTGLNAIGLSPFWDTTSWAKITMTGSSTVTWTTGVVSSGNRANPTKDTDGSLKFTASTAGSNPAFFVDVKDAAGLQSQPLIANWDSVFSKAGSAQDDKTFQYSYNLKATGNFNLILWNTSNVFSDFSSGSAGLKLAVEGDKITFASRAGAAASIDASKVEYKANEYNRFDLFTTRTGGGDAGKVQLKIYINGWRIVWENTNEASCTFDAGKNYVGDANQNANFGPRFTVVPTGSTTVNINKVS